MKKKNIVIILIILCIILFFWFVPIVRKYTSCGIDHLSPDGSIKSNTSNCYFSFTLKDYLFSAQIGY
ncbi:MAG: hypothetical protein AAB913_00315 [Patescibacteria group bacterium]